MNIDWQQKIQELTLAVLKNFEQLRLDGLLLYLLGLMYFYYIHRKHDVDIRKGLMGENNLWEAPEVVVYYWVQSFPPLLFADAFLGFHLSDGMMFIYTIILFFAIMGRAGIELLLSWKLKILNGASKTDEKPKGDI